MVIKCPKCNKLLEVPKEKLGKKEVCEHCDNVFVVDESIIYKPKEEVTPKLEPEQQVKPAIQEVSPPKPKRRSKTPLIIIGSIIGVIVLVFVIAIIVAAVEETRQEEARQVETQRQQNAFRQIIVKDIDFEGAMFRGGIDLNSITLSNPTKYAFRSIRYQFYDANDNVVKIDNYVGPLMPYETKKFSIDLHSEGLWEHKYGVRIVAGEVAE